jgi:hypothetical protein
MALATPDEFTRHLAKARATKLPITVQNVLYTNDDAHVAVLISFADGSAGGCLVPLAMLTDDNIRIGAAVTAAVWEMLKPPLVYRKKGCGEEVIDLDG